ncbi:MAG: LacI family transcriptional regulator [Clostridiales bacterium]|jgi:DNA-binding LacI/PurR family transcriptional regulator|nr:LacI family transcriptional regulator [Clostridiales bacterium]
MVTIKDVARHAGLSPSCVSKYFKEKNSVRENSRLRIEEAVCALKYVPSDIARSLRGKRSNAVKVLMPVITRPFFAEVFEYLRLPFSKAGYNLLLQTITDEGAFYPQDFVFADGVIVAFPDDDSVINRLADILEGTGKPLVALLGHQKVENCITVSADISQGMAEAAKYLLASGCERIAFIGGTVESSPSNERFRGFTSVVPPEAQYAIYRRDFSLEWGHTAAQRMYDSGKLPDGVLCENDSIAAGVIRCFLSNGVKIPGDVAVIGFDDTIIADMYWPSITSVSIPIKEMSETAVGILLDAINAKPVSNRSFQSALVVRESS